MAFAYARMSIRDLDAVVAYLRSLKPLPRRARIAAMTMPGTEDGDDEDGAAAPPAGVKNYMTPDGFQRLPDELTHL